MFLPLYDVEVKRFLTPVTILIIILCVLVFIYQSFFVSNENQFFYEWGVVPYKILSEKANDNIFQSSYINLITYAFVHAGFWHILGNLWFLFIFGNNVERRMGVLVFTFFYLSAAVVSAYIHMLFSYPDVMLGRQNIYSLTPMQIQSLNIPLVGASGAISAVLGAYLRYFPKAQIVTLVIFFVITLITVPASLFIGVWLVGQIINAISNPGSSVAWFAHIGGFIYGYIFASIYRGKRDYGEYDF
ncbi:MAG: rhomboid family intramembrane serine protease [Brevinematia bacterium]